MSLPTVPKRLAVEWWGLAVLLSLTAVFLVLGCLTQRLDWAVYDKLLKGEYHSPDPRILIVAIDDQALQTVEPWPWRRDTHARLLERLNAAEPKAIAYDVLFLESKPGDAELGRAMTREVPVFLPLLIDSPGPNGAALDIQRPVPDVARAASGLGHVNLILDSDGRVRRARLAIVDGQHAWPQLMVRVRDALGIRGEARPNQAAGSTPLLIPFSGPVNRFPTVSAAAVIQGQVPDEILQGRIVLVAATAYGLGDRYAVPIDATNGTMSGIEIQANLLDALLSGRSITPAPKPFVLAVTLLVLWLALLCLRRLPPRATLLALLVLAGMLLATSAGSLYWGRLWFSPVPALILLLLCYPIWAWRRLVMISSYVQRRLADLHREPDLFISAAPIATMDPVERQLSLLDDTIGRLRTMRRFVMDGLEQVPDAVFVTDTNGLLLLSNQKGRALSDELAPGLEGASIAPILARCKRTSTVPREFRHEQADEPLWPPPPRGGWAEILSPGGRCFDLRYIPRPAPDGQHGGWVVRLTDITAIWTAQRQREEVLQFLTHDIRSPQISILAILAEAKPSQISASINKRIEHYARRTLSLADGFVQLARAEFAEYDARRENLSDIITEALDDLWPQVQAKQLAVDETGLDKDCFVNGDRPLLARAFINLIDNAVKYSDQGGRISVGLETVTVEGVRQVRCSIANGGESIDPAHLKRLFEKFRRAPSRAGDRADGIGLGLSIVHAIVARHGGSMRARSSTEQGTAFTVSLPLADES